MVAALPKEFAELDEIKNLGHAEFSSFDGFALQEAVWLRDIGTWGRGDALDDLERARSLFDWTVCNIQLDPQSAEHIPQFPWETLFFGRGTATERAWVFILLARQLGIDAAVLGIEQKATDKVESATNSPSDAPAGAPGSVAASDGQGLASSCPHRQSLVRGGVDRRQGLLI